MNTKVTEIKNKIDDKIVDTGARMWVSATNTMGKLATKRIGKMLMVMPLVLACFSAIAVFADTGAEGTAEGMINEIIALLKTWIPRLGGLVVVVGGIQLGLGFKDDNADQKTRGMQCMIGGAIVSAIGLMVEF